MHCAENSQAQILIIGGSGRIGRAVATDLLSHTSAQLTLTGRCIVNPLKLRKREYYQPLDLTDEDAVRHIIQSHHLVIHCAGPFRHRNHHILETCIAKKIPYIDVADSPTYVKKALTYRSAAEAAGVTALVGTGVFPGISCSMVRQGIEALDRVDDIDLSYLVAGSGGAGLTVMRTTFLELQSPFPAKQNGKWQTIQPYSQRSVIEFPHYGKGGVYWFNTVEAMTLPTSFPEVQTVTTKFGSVPDYYNWLTWLVSKVPNAWISQPKNIEALSKVSYRMTQATDRFSGIGIAVKLVVKGIKDEKPTIYRATFYHPDTAIAAGHGTGSIAQLFLEEAFKQPGVWTVEQVLSSDLFAIAMKTRSLRIEQSLSA